MKVLVVNAGSSSLKFQLIDMTDESVIAKGICERIGQDKSVLVFKSDTAQKQIEKPMPDHKVAATLMLEALVNPDYGVIKSTDEISAVGHRVLHAAEDFDSSVKVTPSVLKTIESNVDLGPLHMPPNIMGIKACMEVMPHAPAVAVFDTTFHATMPKHAYMYAIPYNYYTDYKVRKYGFHGTSHLYVSGEAAKLCPKPDCKIIVCHLGNGASISAVRDGKCIDTSMGLTPLEGLVMGTRSGDIDPAVIEFLMGKTGMSIGEIINTLNKKSGVLGVSGLASDFRDLTAAAEKGDQRAILALDIFDYRIKKYVGAYAAALGGLDILAFTAGIGENTPTSREAICRDMEFLGIKLDLERNNNAPRGKTYRISAEDSKVLVYIIPTNEELVIARETVKYM